jgi:hypothetical protein
VATAVSPPTNRDTPTIRVHPHIHVTSTFERIPAGQV